jgi:hypothetical protein
MAGVSCGIVTSGRACGWVSSVLVDISFCECGDDFRDVTNSAFGGWSRSIGLGGDPVAGGDAIDGAEVGG